jgi:hypothetical protein
MVFPTSNDGERPRDSPLDAFVSDVRAAADLSLEENLVSFAVPPTYPPPGMDIYARGRDRARGASVASSFRVESFREKPSADLAAAWLEDGHYYWNSGIYGFRADSTSTSFSARERHIGRLRRARSPRVRAPSRRDTYPPLASRRGRSVRASPVHLDRLRGQRAVRAIGQRAGEFPLGRRRHLDSLSKYVRSDEAALVESRDCFVQSDIPVALCGVDDLVVVIKDGKALVARRGETGLVKDALAELKKKGLL